MGKQTKITVNLDGLDKIRKELGSNMYARVGVLGGGGQHYEVETKTVNGKEVRVATKTETGMTNADVGVIQELGSDTAGIPPRSFLRMPIEYRMREIGKFLGSGTMQGFLETKDIKRCFKALGVFCEGIVDEAFATGGFGLWAPNAASTIARKKSNLPLTDSGQLARSVTSDVQSKGKGS